MKNTERLRNILKLMEENHLNLYHDISKEEVEKYISNMQNFDNLSEIEFDYEMSKFFSIFKDGHTIYFLPNLPSDKQLLYLQNKFYIFHDNKWKEIKFFGKLTTKQFTDKLKEMISYETQAWLDKSIEKYANNLYTYKMLRICDANNSVYIKTIDGDKIELNITKNQMKDVKTLPYEFKVMRNNVLYVRYSQCQENKNYTFNKFIKDIKKVVSERGIRKYILDVRNNFGGNSEILNPFQDFVKKEKLKGVMLINRGVFSSGRFAVARFKKEFNIQLVGEPTGGAAKSYGYSKRLEVDGKQFSVSIRLWDFSDIFGYEGSIQPDIYIPKTIEDFAQGKDNQLEKALEVLSNLN